MAEAIQKIPVNIEEEMKRSYLDYAMSVIIGRALPDARDGLKPVHRRILFAMHESGLGPGKPFKKSATVVGDVLGRYHPHGDSAVYDALVRMAQDFSMRYPLINGQGNFGCFTGDTKIKLLDGTEATFAELAELPSEEIFHVYSVNADGRIVVGEGRHSRITRRNAELVELTFDDGSRVRCTPDHRFMLRDGTWKEAQSLTIEDSLMAGYFDTSPINDRTNDYLRVLQPKTGRYEFVHWLADEYNEQRGSVLKKVGPYVRHHKNWNRFDNRPGNIERMNWLDHLHLHAGQIKELWQNPQFREAQRQGVQTYYATHPEAVEARRQRMIAQNKDEAFRISNGPRVSLALREMHERNPEIARQHGEYIRQLWKDPDYRARMSRALRGIEKRPLTAAQKERVRRIISEKSRLMWKDADKREAITKAIICALSDPKVRARISENSRRLWQDDNYRAQYNSDHHSRMAKRLWDNPNTRQIHREKILNQWQDPAFKSAHLKGRRRAYATQSARNPNFMIELAEKAATVLCEKWQDPNYSRQVMRTKIAGYVSRLLAEFGQERITPELYDTQRSANWIPGVDKALKYFESFDEMLSVAATHNHRVLNVRWLSERVDVYDITVNEHHNFMLANGCIVHNSIDGDSAAAYRYTEARLTRVATEMLADIDKDTVDHTPNYDESRLEPTVLPTRVPNLLVNGAEGIAVGMATKIPPHNLTEVIEATIHLIQNPNAQLKTLMNLIPGPDFPTGGFIYGREGILQAYKTGRGSIIMRARAAIDRAGRAGERMAIVITEIPFQVNKAKLIERIAELINDKKIEGISDLRDESDREGMRIVIELKRDAIPDIVLNNLYKLTPMQQSFGVINLAIVNGQPRELNLTETLSIFIDHRREVVIRRTRYELKKAEARAHILEGLKKAIDNLDAVISTIRKSKSTPEAREALMERFKFTDIQARAILEMQLQKLTGLERQKLVDEYKEVIRRIAELQEILANESVLRNVIIKELREVQHAYGDKRRTEIIEAGAELSLEDLIADEDMAITVTHSGYIKRTPVSVYRAQRRGGTGRRGAALKTEDVVDHLFVASAHSYIMIFTSNGQVYKLKVHEIPDAGAAARGKAIVNLVNMQKGEKVAGIVPVRDFEEGRYVVFATRKGTVKKTELSEYANIRSNGINAMGIDDDDELIAVELTDGKMKIFIATHEGMAICFNESDARPMGRPAYGVRGITLDKGDFVISVAAVSGEEDMLSISENGFGKRTNLEAYRVQSRGGKGVINMKTSDRNGKVVAVLPVNDESQVLIITNHGKLIRVETKTIRESGRSTQGVKLIDTSDGDMVSSASLIERQQDATDKTEE